ncbi:MAG: hypothetical protein GC182_10925 [Rhodopseudomonas sp.]|nr:hypothetical protein [Rhodopseudomonas sp.]
MRIGFAVLGIATLAAGPALAEPMKCSKEESACIAVCAAGTKAKLSNCLTACGASQSYCKKTGCWINGAKNYCGLAKQ